MSLMFSQFDDHLAMLIMKFYDFAQIILSNILHVAYCLQAFAQNSSKKRHSNNYWPIIGPPKKALKNSNAVGTKPYENNPPPKKKPAQPKTSRTHDSSMRNLLTKL